MVSDEYYINNPNSDTEEDSVDSTQHIYGSRDSKYSAEAINDDGESVTSINEEDEMKIIQ